MKALESNLGSRLTLQTALAAMPTPTLGKVPTRVLVTTTALACLVSVRLVLLGLVIPEPLLVTLGRLVILAQVATRARRYPGAGYGPGSNGAANFYVYKPGIIPLRPLSIGDIYQGAFAAIKTNARTMFGFTAALLGVVLVISIATNYAIINLVLPNYVSADSPYATAFTSLSGSFSQLGGTLLQALATVLLSGLIVVAVSRSVLGRVASSKEVWERTKSKFLPLIGLNIITGIISGLMVIIGIVAFFCAVS